MSQPFYPQQPQYPQQPMAPQYAQYPPQPQYPQQPVQYAQPAPAPSQPLVQGSLSDFFNQPSTGGGPVFSWKGKAIGTTYAGIVARPITQADVQQQTQPGTNQPAFFRDGRPKFLMKVPLTVPQSPEFPDGSAQWWVGGSARDELARAMTEAGCEPNSVPEVGAGISVTLVGERPAGPGMNPAKSYAVRYSRPQGALPASVPVHGPALAADIARQMQQQVAAQPATQPVHQMMVQPAQPGQPPLIAPVQQQQPGPAYVQQPPQAVHISQPQQQPMAPVQQQPMAQPQQPQQPMAQQVPAPGNELTPDQQQLLASLTGAG